MHEASLHETNSFITLTYSEEKLRSPKLQYEDFQSFVKDLRTKLFDDLTLKLFPTLPRAERRKLWNRLPKESRDFHYSKIQTAVLVAGEYGDKKKRPHWHAIVFNWCPPDPTDPMKNERGDTTYSSKTLSELWPHGISNFGAVTFESAGYVARYALKKLAHGKDGEHDFNPISRRSSKNAIGKKWIEKNWRDVFTTGSLIFKRGDRYIKTSVPRYYEKWLKQHQPDAWIRYVTEVKPKIIDKAILQEQHSSLEERRINALRSARQGLQYRPQVSRNEAREKILDQKNKTVRGYQKL